MDSDGDCDESSVPIAQCVAEYGTDKNDFSVDFPAVDVLLGVCSGVDLHCNGADVAVNSHAQQAANYIYVCTSVNSFRAVRERFSAIAYHELKYCSL